MSCIVLLILLHTYFLTLWRSYVPEMACLRDSCERLVSEVKLGAKLDRASRSSHLER
jgi:hypothetical protein